jgi:CHASE3 domain sensor protein
MRIHLTSCLTAAALFASLSISPALQAQQSLPTGAQNSPIDSHIVSSADMQHQLDLAATTRKSDIDNLSQFLSSPIAEQAMKTSHVDSSEVRNAVPTLSNAELANLSGRASHAQQQFAAGALSRDGMIIAILGIVIIVLIVVWAA